MILRADKLFGDHHVIDPLMGEALHLGGIDLAGQVDALRLFGKQNRHVKALCRHTGDADAAGLDGQDFVDGLIRKQALELHAHLVEQLDIHEMIQEAVHLQHVTLGQDSVPANPLFQQFHMLILLFLCAALPSANNVLLL